MSCSHVNKRSIYSYLFLIARSSHFHLWKKSNKSLWLWERHTTCRALFLEWRMCAWHDLCSWTVSILFWWEEDYGWDQVTALTTVGTGTLSTATVAAPRCWREPCRGHVHGPVHRRTTVHWRSEAELRKIPTKRWWNKLSRCDWSDVTRGDLAHMCVDGAILYDIYLNTIWFFNGFTLKVSSL